MIQRSEQARTSGSRPRARGLPRRTAIVLVTALSGCSSAETVSPVPTETTTETTTETPTATTTTTPPDGSPAKRTVSLRSPLAGPANNLLLDGDFELSTSYGTGQYGWRMFNANGTGEIPMTVETGGLCRTGLTCVRVQRGQIFLGRGTAAAGGKSHFMDLWARMPEGVGCANRGDRRRVRHVLGAQTGHRRQGAQGRMVPAPRCSRRPLLLFASTSRHRSSPVTWPSSTAASWAPTMGQ